MRFVLDSLATPITPELQADNLPLASCSLYNDNDMFAWSPRNCQWPAHFVKHATAVLASIAHTDSLPLPWTLHSYPTGRLLGLLPESCPMSFSRWVEAFPCSRWSRAKASPWPHYVYIYIYIMYICMYIYIYSYRYVWMIMAPRSIMGFVCWLWSTPTVMTQLIPIVDVCCFPAMFFPSLSLSLSICVRVLCTYTPRK